MEKRCCQKGGFYQSELLKFFGTIGRGININWDGNPDWQKLLILSLILSVRFFSHCCFCARFGNDFLQGIFYQASCEYKMFMFQCIAEQSSFKIPPRNQDKGSESWKRVDGQTAEDRQQYSERSQAVLAEHWEGIEIEWNGLFHIFANSLFETKVSQYCTEQPNKQPFAMIIVLSIYSITIIWSEFF